MIRAAGAALALALMLPTAARPQRADSSRADSARADSTRIQKLAPTVITGTRLSDVDERLPGQVDRVDMGNVGASAAGAARALARLPGVSAFDDQGSPAQPTLEIRGFSISPVVGVPQGVSVFLDGVRVNEPDAQEVNFDLLPIDAVARSQLVRGPATLYGKNTLAGALLLFTRRGEDVPVLEGELNAGSYGAFGATVNAGGKTSGIDAYLSANFFEESAWREQGGLIERSVFLNLGRKRDSSDIALSVLYARDSIAEPGSLPASWLAVNPRLNYTGGDFFAPQLWHLALRGERPLGVGKFRGALFYRHNDSEQFNVNVNAASSDALLKNESYGVTAEWSAPLRAFARPLQFTTGAELARNDVAESIYARLTSDPSVVIPPECDAATGLCADVRVPERDAALFAQATLELSPFAAITAAARGDWVRVPFEDVYDPANSATSTFAHLSPRLGANFTISPTVRGFASVSGGFRAPAPVELGCATPSAPCPLPYALGSDPPLNPVTLTSYEAGADWEPRGGATLDASLFWSDVHNEIVFVASTNTQGYFQNIPHTRRQGVEIGGTLPLPLGLHASASYTYLEASYQSTVVLASQFPVPDTAKPGNTFPLSPHNRVTFALGATEVLGSGALDAELAVNAVSPQFVRGDDANILPQLPGYAVWRLRVTYELPHVSVSASVRNLFDRQFSSFATYAANPLPPPGSPSALGDPYCSAGGATTGQVERFCTPAQPRSFSVAVKVSR